MKIIGLQAENVKRLKAVSIEPDGTLQVITGSNGAGKSSLLDAIWLALGGGDAAKTVSAPIRKGESKAKVTLDLGSITVTRSWTQYGTRLKVEGKDGSEYKSPQTLLDALVGAVGFDPLSFTRIPAKKQREMLLGLLNIDLDELDQERAEVYEKRTELGRELKALGEIVDVSEDAPTEERSGTGLLKQLREAQDHNLEVDITEKELEENEERIEELKEELAQLEKTVKQNKTWLSVNVLVDTDQLESDLSDLEEYNKRARDNAAAIEKALQASRLNRKISKATRRIKQIDNEKQEEIESADFPVNGLGFDEDGVTLNGLPFEQASSAEQIKVSVAIGMALNPDLRVLMVKDGSLLDPQSMATLREMAEEHDHQILVESVYSDDPAAIVMEAGEVK